MRRSFFAATALAVLFAVAGSVSLVQADDAVLAQREQAMKGMGAQMKIIKDLVGNAGPAGDVVAPARKIAEIAATIPTLFPEGSGGDEVRPEIWQNWDDFKAKAQALGDEATMLAAAAEGGDMATVGAQFDKVGGACSACHKAYRK
jgi:cytochrome c556